MSPDLDPQTVVDKAVSMAASCLGSRPNVAEMLLRQTLKVDPAHAKALSLLGLTLFQLGKSKESITYFRESITHDSSMPDTYNNLSLAYSALGNYAESIDCLEKALQLKPDHHLFLNNLALQYRNIGDEAQAERFFRAALEMSGSPMVWCNLGGLLVDQKRLDEAEASYLEAIKIDPELPAPHVFLAYVHGYRGNWEKAFTEYEWRFKHFDQLKHYNNVYTSEKRWRGENPFGKTIILFGEQGLGDQIQYVRYARHLKALGANVIIHCSAQLSELFSRAPWIDQVIHDDIAVIKNTDLPMHDFHCSLVSLPLLLNDFQPDATPYLKPASVLSIKDVEEYRNDLAVGIAWTGSPAHPNDQRRSMYLREFKPLQMKGVRLFNLQIGASKRYYPIGDRTIDFAEGGSDLRLVDLTPLMTNYDQSASVISGLDLVISVDTSIVHLAGALGIPCFVLLPYNSDWRWEITGSRTQWYESLRLFRQIKPGDWGSVIKIVKSKLEDLVITHK